MQEYNDLIQLLNKATKAYDEGNPIMSDVAWDKLYWQAVEIEKTHAPHPDSPTQKVNYQVVNELTKVQHSSPMLSLNKTKSLEELNNFVKDQVCFLSLKLDGLTCRLTYAQGRLVRAETRGNGILGEDITHNARVIKGIPNILKVPADLVIDGEVICTDKDFEPFSKEYKNSRNFAAGSLRLLDAKECAQRNLTFVSWNIVEGMEEDNCKTHTDKLLNLTSYGRFLYVPFEYTAPHNQITQNLIDHMTNIAKEKGYPIDGLVLKYDNIKYGESLGATAHHWRNGLAYKFFDETYPTILKDIEWSMGRTGILTPVAVFEPLDIDGSIIERANLHNIEIMRQILHGNGWKGQNIEVYKSNMIIPQLSFAEPDNEETHEYFEIPHKCPICGSITSIKQEVNSSNLYCDNSNCEGKLVNRINHYCSKDKGLDIRGLSKATLEKLIEWGWVASILDIYNLDKYKAEWIEKPGFGETSVSKVLSAIEASKETTLQAFICALGIPLIGRTVSMQLVQFIESYEDFRNKINSQYDFSQHPGFGYEKVNSLLKFDYTEADKLYQIINIKNSEPQTNSQNVLDGLTFCITGKLYKVKNRDELINIIQQNGGKFVKSISKNVKYLINNDINSTTAKNKEAQSLGIPIITEEKFFEMI